MSGFIQEVTDGLTEPAKLIRQPRRNVPVLRVVEMTGQGGRVAIRFSRPVARAESIDFLELGLWGPQPRVEGATVYTELKPFEIQALRVEWDRREE